MKLYNNMYILLFMKICIYGSTTDGILIDHFFISFFDTFCKMGNSPTEQPKQGEKKREDETVLSSAMWLVKKWKKRNPRGKWRISARCICVLLCWVCLACICLKDYYTLMHVANLDVNGIECKIFACKF